MKNGFALVATLLVLMLLAGLVIALLSLANIELRHADTENHRRRAQANARLALVQAIGQLQLAMGPDTRVSASSALVTADGQQHWTGVWNSQAPDGQPWVVRDPETGGLIDRRRAADYQPGKEVMQWLVSGQSSPDEIGSDHVQLVGAGSVADPETMGVKVPALNMLNNGQRGRLAWWTGDLGQRANLSTSSPEDATPLIATQAASELVGDGPSMTPESRRSLVSEASVALSGGSKGWARSHFHDFTVHSRGLLTNVRDGGLKQDLSVYFESDGVINPSGDSPGLRDTDRLAGPANELEAEVAGQSWELNPFRQAAPRFGVLRHWAGLGAAVRNGGMETVSPETESRNSTKVLANLNPAKLAGTLKSSVQPILVEASQCHSFSWFKTSGSDANRHHLRKHLYPKIVLWNPYSLVLTTRSMMVLLQINGRHDFWIDGYFPTAKGKPTFPVHSPWVAFDGGRSRDFVPADGSIFSSPGYKDPHMGSYYYQLEATRFGPGECLVFTPARAGNYRNGIKQDGGDTNLAGNLLTPNQAPHPERCLTISNPPGQPGFEFVPTGISMESTASYFALFGMQPPRNPADDLRVILKDLGEQETVDVDSFDQLPQIASISGSLQYGAGTEPVSPWPGSTKLLLEETTTVSPMLPPDGRTRQGLRLRSGMASPTSSTEALFANWNPRAAFSLRSARERIHSAEGRSGLNDGTWGFGIYERFIPTAESEWTDEFPTEKNGRFHAHPLIDGESGASPVLFDLPRAGVGVFSMGYLQHAKLSDLVWHPSRVIGNSLADPKVGLTGTLPSKLEKRGFTETHLGSSSDGNGDQWAANARDILQGLPNEGEELLYDVTYEANHALWDRFFVSGANGVQKSKFATDALAHPLPNPRLESIGTGGHEEMESALKDFHKASFHLTLNGAFNVNSVSVDAWASVLAGTRRISPAGAVTDYTRIPGDEIRLLDDEEIRRFAVAMVAEVKRRGPFLSISDFVNRRLAPGETGKCGAIESAIRTAGLNVDITGRFQLLDNSSNHSHPPVIPTPLSIDSTLKPDSTAWGREAFLTQGDILQVIGDSLTSRSDTFVIRAYGESADKFGIPQARVWCEAVVQRITEPVRPVFTVEKSMHENGQSDFGRQFRQVGFRWLDPTEI